MWRVDFQKHKPCDELTVRRFSYRDAFNLERSFWASAWNKTSAGEHYKDVQATKTVTAGSAQITGKSCLEYVTWSLCDVIRSPTVRSRDSAAAAAAASEHGSWHRVHNSIDRAHARSDQNYDGQRSSTKYPLIQSTDSCHTQCRSSTTADSFASSYMCPARCISRHECRLLRQSSLTMQPAVAAAISRDGQRIGY